MAWNTGRLDEVGDNAYVIGWTTPAQRYFGMSDRPQCSVEIPTCAEAYARAAEAEERLEAIADKERERILKEVVIPMMAGAIWAAINKGQLVVFTTEAMQKRIETELQKLPAGAEKLLHVKHIRSDIVELLESKGYEIEYYFKRRFDFGFSVHITL